MSKEDGKESVSTTASLLSNIGKLVLAIRILYAVNEKFPTLFPKIKSGAQGALASMMRFALVKRVVDGASGAWQKFGEKFPKVTAGIKGTGSALGKIPSVIMSVTGGFSKIEQITGLLLAIGAPVIAAGLFGLVAAMAAVTVAIARFSATRVGNAAFLADMADSLESTTRSIQGLRAGADATGVKLDDVASAIENIQKASSKAITGTDAFEESFKRLGFSLEEIKRLSDEEIFMRIAQGVRDGKIGAGNWADVLRVMGDEAKRLKPAMQDNLAGLASLFQAVAARESDIRSLDQFNTMLKTTWALVKQLLDTYATASVTKPLKILDFMFGNGPDQLLTDETIAKEQRVKARENRTRSIRAAEKAELAELREKNAERQREVDLSKMSVAERKKALELERQSIQAQIAAEKSEVARERLRENLLKVEGEINQANGTRGSSGEKREVDSLTRIGLFRGTSSSAQVQALNRSIQIQQRQLAAVVQSNQRLSQTVSELQTLNRNVQDT